jgi:hypothetical protein
MMARQEVRKTAAGERPSQRAAKAVGKRTRSR